MASIVVDGFRLPVLVAGHPALELCNTRAGWLDKPKEYLLSYEHLAVFVRYIGMAAAEADVPDAPASPANTDVPGAPEVLDRTLAFREAYYAVLVGMPTDAHWHLLSAECREAAAAARLAPATGAAPARWELPSGDPRTPLWALVRAAAGMLTSPEAGSVRACPGRGCGWVFLDLRGRRRWCSMAWCGNRAKAARHAARGRGS